MITEDTIRERLAADKRKTSRLATWEEIEFLLDRIDFLREQLTLAQWRARRNEESNDISVPPEWAGQ